MYEEEAASFLARGASCAEKASQEIHPWCCPGLDVCCWRGHSPAQVIQLITWRSGVLTTLHPALNIRVRGNIAKVWKWHWNIWLVPRKKSQKWTEDIPYWNFSSLTAPKPVNDKFRPSNENIVRLQTAFFVQWLAYILWTTIFIHLCDTCASAMSLW